MTKQFELHLLRRMTLGNLMWHPLWKLLIFFFGQHYILYSVYIEMIQYSYIREDKGINYTHQKNVFIPFFSYNLENFIIDFFK